MSSAGVARSVVPIAYLGTHSNEPPSTRELVESGLHPSPAPRPGIRLAAISLTAAGLGIGAAAAFMRNLSTGARLGGASLGFTLALGAAFMMSKTVDSQAPSGSSTPTGSAPAAPSGSSTERPDVAFNQQLREGPTPAGGAYSIASYFDESGSPVVKADASNVEIVEYDDGGSAISHTSGTISKR